MTDQEVARILEQQGFFLKALIDLQKRVDSLESLVIALYAKCDSREAEAYRRYLG